MAYTYKINRHFSRLSEEEMETLQKLMFDEDENGNLNLDSCMELMNELDTGVVKTFTEKVDVCHKLFAIMNKDHSRVVKVHRDVNE